MKKIILLTILLSSLLLPGVIKAEDATNSSLTDKIKERLEKTAEAGLDNIKEELIQKSNSPRKKAYIGTIKSIEDSKIILDYKEEEYKIEVNDDTVYSKTSFEDLEIDDFIIAMGFIYPDNDTLFTHRASFIKDPQPPIKRQLITGKVKEVDGNKIAVDGKVLIITSKTNFNIKDVDDAELEDLELEDNLFAIVTLDKNGDIDTIKEVLIIPGKNNPASQEPTNATESAETTESESEE